MVHYIPTLGLLVAGLTVASICAATAGVPSTKSWPDPRFQVGPLLYQEDFSSAALPNWKWELEAEGIVIAAKNQLTIDVPKGATVWFRPELEGPIMIEYEARLVKNGGPHDRVSDLNCFWMAQDPQHPDKLLDTPRSGKFSDYDVLTTYYVGQGGNSNTTTRFRRYIGKPGDRPLLPENDLHEPEYLLTPNQWQRIRLVAFGNLIQYYRDDRRLFESVDPEPYTHGWFGLRTVTSHIEVRHFTVHRLLAAESERK